MHVKFFDQYMPAGRSQSIVAGNALRSAFNLIQIGLPVQRCKQKSVWLVVMHDA
ncbi:MAG: hypothetical protein AB1705_27670 [Verrucomicrobiota bacterium]